jgi:hypothetical protein
VPPVPPAPVSTAAARDALTAVFRQSTYNRSLQETVLARLLGWLVRGLAQLIHAARTWGRTDVGRWTLFGTLLAAIIALIVHSLTQRVGDAAGSTWRGARARAAGGGDPWALAQRLAAEGNYTDAAHALYQALLQALARRQSVRLDDSKTVGDYGRELRGKAPQWVVPYRAFARDYEVVVYGLRDCDRERYERLRQLASAITMAPDRT